jgi:hypothetical protein
VSRLKYALSAYLRKVRAGQTVIIYDRVVPSDILRRAAQRFAARA